MYKEKYKDSEDNLLISKIDDKIKLSRTRNRIEFTDFLNTFEKNQVQKYLNQIKCQNYFFFGGNENTERGIFIFYPDKLNEELVKNKIGEILSVIRIENPKEEKYEHRVYLSAIMKLGIKREKVGEIVVSENGADIIVFRENIQYILTGLKDLTRFRRSNIYEEKIERLSNKKIEFEDLSIIVSSIRLDCFVSELAKCSRAKAEEYIEYGSVFINSIPELKPSKKLQEKDVITIRGKGKFIFDSILKETSKNRYMIYIKKYK